MSYADNIEKVRLNIIEGARLYQNEMVGRYFIYIFEDDYFEMYYGTKNFKHLTGVSSSVAPANFYKLATKGQLQTKQLSFNKRYPLSVALKKSEGLKQMTLFKHDDLFMIKNLATDTATYPYALTNLDKTLLVVFDSILKDNRTYYVPKSFRVNDKNIFNKTNSSHIKSVDFIFSKTDIDKPYAQVEMCSSRKSIPEDVKKHIDTTLINNLNNG